jgi:glycine cleavage system H protein
LPEKGAVVKKGDAVGAIESVKMVADLYCPVNGSVTKVDLIGKI